MMKTVSYAVVALMAGFLAFYLMRSHQMAPSHNTMLDSMPELAWVKSEFNLNEQQFANVSRLHANYRPRCKEMCDRIQKSSAHLEQLCQTQSSLNPQVESAVTAHANLQLECQKEMLKHIYQTSAALDPSQAERYLETVLPQVLNFSHGPSKHHAH
jgi:hypothetical protein